MHLIHSHALVWAALKKKKTTGNIDLTHYTNWILMQDKIHFGGFQCIFIMSSNFNALVSWQITDQLSSQL